MGVRYLSPLDGICSCEAEYIKRSDDEFYVFLKSVNYKKEIVESFPKPILAITEDCVNANFIFYLSEYRYMYKRVWRGPEDAAKRLRDISWQCDFYCNDKKVASIVDNAYYQNTASISIYDSEWSFSKPIVHGYGAHWDIHHTNSVHYKIDLKNDIYVFYRGAAKPINFYAKFTVFGWIGWHKITETSYIRNLEYTYKTNVESTVDGEVIFYESSN